jgi:hypothetical protein
MTQPAHLNDRAHPVPHTLQDQLASHFSEIKTQHDKWMAVKFGRALSEAHWKATHDKRQQPNPRSPT